MNIIRRAAKSVWISWAMSKDSYLNEFNNLKKNYKDTDYKFQQLDITETNEIINLSDIFDECILIMPGNVFRKNRDQIEQNCYLYKIYVFDRMSHLHQNLYDDYPYIKTVTNDLNEIMEHLDKDGEELGKFI